MTTIDDVREAAARKRAADADLERTLALAVHQGLDKSEIALAAGVSRQTVYNVVARSGAADAGAAMDGAMYAILETGAGSAPPIVEALGVRDLLAKARRLELIIKNLRPDAAYTDEIGRGITAAQKLLKSARG